ncbi:DUF1824 family protein [Spirulina sp. 06S082]|uniref:DUF1824 family protein n=1 Tax=Spirulina sp. 06S082 TaxID=3110248 RepID=UPI002B21FEEB|nr:DUF1824 family protein [Spirulina sp. 06S082]MEA5470969.1 DUF1824 family protein [Spirulina sp. 06S082]
MNATSDLTHARKILDSFSGVTPKVPASETEAEELRQAIRLMTTRSESENLGVCADNSSQGYRVLAHYLEALGYAVPFAIAEIESVDTPVYIKFNTAKMSHYLDAYEGNYRGVLIACQSEEEEINGTYGHFPLNLFGSP